MECDAIKKIMSQFETATMRCFNQRTINIDPNISAIVPNLIITAPLLFSSNLPEDAMEGKNNNFHYF